MKFRQCYLVGGSYLPTGGPPDSFSVHMVSSTVIPAGSVHTSRSDHVLRIWVQLKRRYVLYVGVLQRGHSGDGCDWGTILCKYDMRKGDLFVLSWARVRRLKRGSMSSELLMYGGGPHSFCYCLF